MVAAVHMQTPVLRNAAAAVAPVAALAAAAAQPAVSEILDTGDASGQYALYKLDDGRIAVAASGLTAGTALPAGGVLLKSGDKAWSSGKATSFALLSDASGFQVIMKTGDGPKAKFSRQVFDPAGIASGKAAALNLATALESEVTAAQDLNGDGLLGDVIARVVDATDDAQAIGLYVLTSGKVVIDSDGQSVGTRTGAQTVTLTKNGKNWIPGKLQALAVRSTNSGYEVLLKSGTGAKAAYLYQSFDSSGKMLEKAQKASADVLLDRELLYGQDLNGDGQRGNVVKTVIDPTAPIDRNLAISSPYARSTKVNGEVFLGGRYIELGLSAWGNFGTAGSKPAGFFGAPNISGIGMSADHDGYGNGRSLAVDYFLPGTPEERFAVGYQTGGTTATTSNSERMSARTMPTVVSDESKGRMLSALATSTWAPNGTSVMTVKQAISFDAESLWFKNRVTLTNETATDWTSARFMRSFDPDNTAAQGGSYATKNTVIGTYALDGYAAVQAETFSDSDPLYAAFRSRSPIMFFTMDTKAVASIFGFSNTDPYDASVYTSPAARNTPIQADRAITLTWDAGPLKAGESAVFDYYTSLDNRAADAIISEIFGVGLYQMQSGSYAVAKAPAKAGDLPDDRVILKDKGKSWAPRGGTPLSVRANVEGYEVTYKTGTGAKTKYFLQKFDTDGNTTGKAEKLTTAKLVDLENPFEQDINSDMVLGNKVSGIVDNADPSNLKGLYKLAGGGLWLAKNDLAIGSELPSDAVKIVAKGKPWAPTKETPLAIRVNNGLYELVSRTGIGTAAKYTQYTIDQNGAFVGKGKAIKSDQIGSRETAFGQDLNGNGTIGS
jgi:NAD/NADP transhydrogenase alpha subunit